MKTNASFLALTMIVAVGSLACSSTSTNGDPSNDAAPGSDTGTLPGSDGGGGDGAKTDSGKADAKGGDGPTGTDASTAHGKTTGKPCTDDTVCDVLKDGVNHCSNSAFSLGTIDPSPVCVGNECDLGDGSTIMDCDGMTGVCLDDGASGLCVPACDFADDGAAPTRCVGKDVCTVYGWGKDASGKLTGIGYCWGGCVADADCTGGDKCQKESGNCVKALNTYTKVLGDPCTDADATAPAKCECLYLSPSNKGYCSTFCKVGDATATCPTDYKCSPGLPTKDSTDGSALFSKDPIGIGGNCLKTCATDADCTALNSACMDMATGKVCYPKG